MRITTTSRIVVVPLGGGCAGQQILDAVALLLAAAVVVIWGAMVAMFQDVRAFLLHPRRRSSHMIICPPFGPHLMMMTIISLLSFPVHLETGYGVVVPTIILLWMPPCC